MRYLLKQKLLCFGDDFTGKNQNGEDMFFVNGKALGFDDKFSLQAMNGREQTMAEVSKRWLSPSDTCGVLVDIISHANSKHH